MLFTILLLNNAKNQNHRGGLKRVCLHWRTEFWLISHTTLHTKVLFAARDIEDLIEVTVSHILGWLNGAVPRNDSPVLPSPPSGPLLSSLQMFFSSLPCSFQVLVKYQLNRSGNRGEIKQEESCSCGRRHTHQLYFVCCSVGRRKVRQAFDIIRCDLLRRWRR
jgi:hypothetical protein